MREPPQPRGYAVRFHVLVGTRWAEYLRENAYGKEKKGGLDDARDTFQFLKAGLSAVALPEPEMAFRSDKKEKGLTVRVIKRAGVKGH